MSHCCIILVYFRLYYPYLLLANENPPESCGLVPSVPRSGRLRPESPLGFRRTSLPQSRPQHKRATVTHFICSINPGDASLGGSTITTRLPQATTSGLRGWLCVTVLPEPGPSHIPVVINAEEHRSWIQISAPGFHIPTALVAQRFRHTHKNVFWLRS